MNSIRIFITGIIFLGLTLMIQAQRTGGVCISDSLAEAHESAMLHIISTTKGLLLPTLTSAERDRIKPLTPGLTIYVVGTENPGFQYWTGEKWSSLEVINDRTASLIAPLGGIIMYHGKFDNFDESGKGLPGTEMEGWHLCNGKNNTPNLSAKFIVGGGTVQQLLNRNKDPQYNNIGKTGNPPAKLIIRAENMPPHSHTISSVGVITHNHTHNLTSENEYTLRGKSETVQNGHTHGFYSKPDGGMDGSYLSRRTDRCGWFGGQDCDVTAIRMSETIDLNAVHVGEGRTSNGSVPKVEFTIDESVIGNAGDKKTYEFDNRPRYYVLAFIIRIDDNVDEGGYKGPFTISYDQ